jgi:inorganic pyrophosphatase
MKLKRRKQKKRKKNINTISPATKTNAGEIQKLKQMFKIQEYQGPTEGNKKFVVVDQNNMIVSSELLTAKEAEQELKDTIEMFNELNK